MRNVIFEETILVSLFLNLAKGKTGNAFYKREYKLKVH